MKQLVGILAHKAKPQLNWLVDTLIADGFDVLIHLDQKNSAALRQLLGARTSYCISQEYKVQRGHFSLLKASQALMEQSLHSHYDYYHLISGEDIPIKSVDRMNDILIKAKGASFINYNLLPIKDTNQKESRPSIFKDFTEFSDQIPTSNYKHFAFLNGIGLVQHRHFAENSLFTQLTKSLHSYQSYWKIYHLLFKRQMPTMEFYAGSAWYSLSRSIVQDVVNWYKAKTDVLDFFKQVGFPDEIFVQSISQQLNQEHKIINSDLRYVQWDQRSNHGSGYLTKESLHVLKNSNAFFARKWDIATKEEFQQIYHYLCSREST